MHEERIKLMFPMKNQILYTKMREIFQESKTKNSNKKNEGICRKVNGTES